MGFAMWFGSRPMSIMPHPTSTHRSKHSSQSSMASGNLSVAHSMPVLLAPVPWTTPSAQKSGSLLASPVIPQPAHGRLINFLERSILPQFLMSQRSLTSIGMAIDFGGSTCPPPTHDLFPSLFQCLTRICNTRQPTPGRNIANRQTPSFLSLHGKVPL